MAADEVRLQRVVDRSELFELSLRYARGVDRLDMNMLRSAFWEDAIIDLGSYFNGSVDDLIPFENRLIPEFSSTMHYIVNALYNFAEDSAEGEIYLLGYHRTKENTKSMFVGGRYLDHYRRRNGVWKILFRSIVWDYFDVSATSVDGMSTLSQLGPIAGRSDDHSYSVLPSFGARNL